MKIFVAKLAFKTTTEDLRALFEQFGTVDSCRVIMDHETGRSKCYGFVEMPNDDEAYKAIVETDETVFMGNELQVKKSRPQTTTTPKPEKPVRPKRPHHPYVPKTEELSWRFAFFWKKSTHTLKKSRIFAAENDGLVAQLDRATAF